MASEDTKDLYFVAVKALIRNADKLLIVHDIFGEWEIPGGRIRKDEFSTPLEAVLERKITEELGPNIHYRMGNPQVFFRVERTEHDETPHTVHIFGIGYEVFYEGGEIQLGEHHDQLEWVSVIDFEPQKYLTTGWLEGVEEYLKRDN